MNATATLPLAGTRPGPASQSRLRLTRRGRLVLIGLPLMLLSVVLLLLLGVFTAPVKAATLGEAAPGNQAVKTTVLAGQTLWGIAATADPSRDPRDVVQDILELNNLSSSVVHPGQQLFVPGHR